MARLKLLVQVTAIVLAPLLACGDEPLPPDLGTRQAGVDWPSFLGPTHDSKSSETGLISPWPAEGPRLVWQQALGTGYALPAISRGRAVLFHRVGNEAEALCVRSETGERLWRFAYATEYEDMYGYENGPRCYPVIDGDRVYLYGAEGLLHCLRVETGELVWKVDTAREFGVVQNFFGVGSTPLVEGELLIVQVGGSPKGSDQAPLSEVQGNGSAVVAFDKRSGEVRYRVGDELASYAVPRPATIAGRRWCFIFARGGLLGLEPLAGKVEFHFPWRAPILESVNASNPVVVGDEVLISETYGPGAALLKVRPGGYDVVWSDAERRRDKSLQTHWNTPVVVDGHIYASSGRHTPNAELRCVDWKTGEVRWRQEGLGRASLLHVEGHFIVQCEYGELLLIKVNPEKFELVSAVALREPAEKTGAPVENATALPPRRLLEYPAWGAPILSHGLLYVRGKGRVACLEVIPSPAARP